MVVVVAVPWFKAEAPARQETEARLRAAERQAESLIAQRRAEAESAFDRAALLLASDREALEALTRGPATAAQGVAGRVAERVGLDRVVVRADDGTVLSSAGDDVPAPAWTGTRPVRAGNELLVLEGVRAIGAAVTEAIAASTGESVALIGPDGSVAAAVGGSAAGRVSSDVGLGDGWSVRVHAVAGDVERVRQDLLNAAKGVAPFALAAALVAALLLAAGVGRPVTALADRADAIARERAGFATILEAGDELERLDRSFDRMLEALEASERQRLTAERVAAWQEVARRVAHEVRNALSPIRLAVENLKRTREKAPAELDAALAAESATILEEVESLRRLVDTFTEFARMPAPMKAPCDLAAVVRQALALHQPRAQALGVEIEERLEPVTLQADADQIGRVVKNIVGNALDALEAKEGERRLDVEVRADGTIVVSDTGVGIDPRDLARVFEPYFTTRAERGGSGLGMAIAYRIVQEHGGTIRVEGAKGRGAIFTVCLPLETPAPPGA
jgi:signal transduction histidine kinase